MKKKLLKFVEEPMELYRQAFLAMKKNDYLKTQDDLMILKSLGIDMDFLVDNNLVYMYQMAKRNFMVINMWSN